MEKKPSRKSSSGYQKGEQRRAAILVASEQVLIESGYHNLSLRKVATQAGISIGNLQYYFPNKSDLIHAMLDDIIVDYLEVFDSLRSKGSPEQQFTKIVELVMTDLQEQRTTIILPELWSLANHEAGVTEQLDLMYERYRQVLSEVIKDINPSLTKREVTQLALFISSSIEGHTMFIGHNKPMKKELKAVIKLATASFLWLIKRGIVDNP